LYNRSNKQYTSNICAIDQISNIHHYLQVEEPEEAKETGEAGELKVVKKTLSK
jgi:hypothetical protein